MFYNICMENMENQKEKIRDDLKLIKSDLKTISNLL